MEEKGIQNGKKLGKKLIIFFIVIWISISFANLCIKWMEYRDGKAEVENEAEKQERNKLPNFESEMQDSIFIVGEKYQEIDLVNYNETINVLNGVFGAEYIISVIWKGEIIENFCCKGVFLNPKVFYEQWIPGGIFLIKANTDKYLEKAKEIWSESIKNYSGSANLEVEFQTSILIYFEYMNNGEEIGRYYLMKLTKDGCEGVEILENAEEFLTGFFIDIE